MADLTSAQMYPIPSGLTPVQRRAFLAIRRFVPIKGLPPSGAHKGVPGTTFYEDGWWAVQTDKTTVQRIALGNY